MKIKTIILALFFSLCTYANDETSDPLNNVSLGNSIDNNFGFVNYESVKVDGVSKSFTGFAFGGYVELDPKILFGAGYTSLSVSDSGTTANLTGSTLTLAYVYTVDASSNLLIALSLLSSAIQDSGNSKVHDSNTAAGAVYQKAVSQNGELSVAIQAVDGSNSISFGYEIKLNPKFSLRAGLSTSDGSSGYSVGA